MTRAIRGTVINIHELGATVRLADGTLAAIAEPELASNRPAYVTSRDRRSELDFLLDRRGRHAIVTLAHDAALDLAFERQIGAYLKETQEWSPADRPEPAERHFIRKKRRAALFEARKRPT